MVSCARLPCAPMLSSVSLVLCLRSVPNSYDLELRCLSVGVTCHGAMVSGSHDEQMKAQRWQGTYTSQPSKPGKTENQDQILRPRCHPPYFLPETEPGIGVELAQHIDKFKY